MNPIIIRLILPHIREIMELTPSVCLILKDPECRWDFKDFVLIWANKVAKKYMPNEISKRSKINIKSQFNSVKSYFKMVESFVSDGKAGFFGPYPYTTINNKGIIAHLEFNVMFLGHSDHENFFLILAQDKTGEMSGKDIEHIEVTNFKVQGDKFSEREKTIVSLIIEGFSTKQIATKLNASKRTIDNHRSNIRRKMNITNQSISIIKCLSNLDHT